MRTFFIVAGCAWIGLALVFVLALIAAARRPVPAPPGLALRCGPPARESSDGESLPLAEETEATQAMIDV